MYIPERFALILFYAKCIFRWFARWNFLPLVAAIGVSILLFRCLKPMYVHDPVIVISLFCLSRASSYHSGDMIVPHTCSQIHGNVTTFSCFREANLPPRTTHVKVKSQKEVQEITRQYTTLIATLSGMLILPPHHAWYWRRFARFIEDRISCAREIAHNADLYGERSRHWPTVDPISIFV